MHTLHKILFRALCVKAQQLHLVLQLSLPQSVFLMSSLSTLTGTQVAGQAGLLRKAVSLDLRCYLQRCSGVRGTTSPSASS